MFRICEQNISYLWAKSFTMLLAILTIVLKINIYPGQWKQQQETSVKYKRNVEYVETKKKEING